MSLRVPTSTTYSQLERGLAVSLSRVQQLQGQLASGSRIQKLSDDPSGAATGLRLRSQETDWTSYQRTGEDASASIAVTDGALQHSSDTLASVRLLAISANSSAMDGASRSAIADQIAGLRAELTDAANMQHLGRAVFGGHKAAAVSATGTPPVYAYVGDDGKVSRQVSPSVTVQVNLDGKDVFGFNKPTGQDVFNVLTRLEAAVRSGDKTALATSQTELAASTSSVSSAVGHIGALTNQVDAATELGKTILDGLSAQRSQVEDVDLAATVLRLQAAENGYSAALGAVARANLPSLASFLR